MKYYSPTVCEANSIEEDSICQLVADKAEKCGYIACNRRSVGAVAHRTWINISENKRSEPVWGSQFLPVCKKHKDWEFRKLFLKEG